MDKETVYNEPSNVSAEEGAVAVAGPDAVDVAITPEAADRLLSEAVRARGRRRLSGLTHRPK